jgi:hypothetical protein
MSEFTSIRAVSRTLKSLLSAQITDSAEPQLAGVPIDLRSPKEMREAEVSPGVSLWLYRVTRNGFLLNRPPERAAANQLLPAPFPLDLYYLVTPLSTDPEARQALLGRVVQVLNDAAVLRGSDLRDSLAGSAAELRLSMETLSLEELTRIWDALQEPYDLSVTYLVQVIAIDTDREAAQVSPVMVKETDYRQILSVKS